MTEFTAVRDAGDVLFLSVEAALVLSCLRTHGERLTADIELEVARREYDLRVLPLPAGDQVAPVVRAALAQRRLDRGRGWGRLEMGVDAAGRVWLCYRPPHWFGPGLRAPSVGLAAVPPVVTRSWYQGRHGLTAARYGGPTVTFVHTHDMADGDPLDAGYFDDRGRPPAGDEHYLRIRGLDLPVPGALVPLGDAIDAEAGDDWKAWSRVAVRMSVLADLLGAVGAVAVVEHAWRIALGGLYEWLPAGFGIERMTAPADAARLYAAVLRTTGAWAEIDDGDQEALVRHGPLPDPSGTLIPAVVTAIDRAWSAILPNFEWTLRATSLPLTGAGAAASVRFDLLGPEG